MDSVRAEDVEYSVDIETGLNLSIPSAVVRLELTPTSTNPAFDTKDLDLSISTNNKTGYTLNMSTASTDLTRTSDSETIPTLSSGSYTESNFTTNRFGISLNNKTSYIPLASSATAFSSTGPVNAETKTISFAAKVDSTKPTGSYSTTINLQLVANYVSRPLSSLRYMQDVSATTCSDSQDGETATLKDKRDGKSYTVAKIAGNCWTTQNLAYELNNGSNTLSPETSNVSTTTTFTATDAMTSTTNAAIFHTPTAAQRGSLTETEIGTWYNYCATTAGQICQSSTTTEATRDICPRGWHLPKRDEFQTLVANGATTNISALKPVFSGTFADGVESIVGVRGYHWSSTAFDETFRYYLRYDGNGLSVDPRIYRYLGGVVRCVTN